MESSKNIGQIHSIEIDLKDEKRRVHAKITGTCRNGVPFQMYVGKQNVQTHCAEMNLGKGEQTYRKGPCGKDETLCEMNQIRKATRKATKENPEAKGSELETLMKEQFPED